MGDLVDVGQDYAEWEAWFAAAAGAGDAAGDADRRQSRMLYARAEVFPTGYFSAQFALPRNGPTELVGQLIPSTTATLRPGDAGQPGRRTGQADP